MEIKFRAFDYFNGEAFFSDTSLAKFFAEVEARRQGGNKVDYYLFTGLKDKNGDDIYAGDVILYSNKDGHHCEFSRRFVVEFGEQDLGHASYQQTIGWNATPIDQYGKESFMDSGRLSHGLLDLFGCHYVEVIGHIYENPELLESQQKDNGQG